MSRWHKAVMNVETKASAAGLSGTTTTSTIPLLPFVMDALSLDSMQRRLRDGLDLIASVWREPRLVCHWVYGDDEDDAAEKPLHAMVDLTIELGGRVCAALSVMVCGGRVHAQYMGGGGAGGGGGEAEALQVFPMAAVRGVGAAEDGCAALIELVHAGLGRALLLRVQRRAAAAGLKAELGAMATRLNVEGRMEVKLSAAPVGPRMVLKGQKERAVEMGGRGAYGSICAVVVGLLA